MVPNDTYAVSADFRDDPILVAILRKAISVVGFAVPEFDDATLELLIASYRESKGERGYGAQFSPAKQELDAHSGKFRSQYSSVLGSCLYSQLDRLQGRESFWPSPDNDSPELVPDSVIERRLVIDELTRLIDVDADEGVKTFDVLVCKALGRESTTLRDNPLRPAVFFHALGLCWTRSSEDTRDEMLVLRKFGPVIAPRIASVYPMMTAILRDGLGIPKPNSSALLKRRSEADGKLYGRVNEDKLAQAEAALGEAIDETSGHLANNPSAGLAPALSKPKSVNAAASAMEQIQSALDLIIIMFENSLNDDRLPMTVRMAIARMQLPFTKTALAEPTSLATANHPLRKLMRDLMNPIGWDRLAGGPEVLEAIVMHIGVISELLKRERKDPARDALLYEHLRSQFLALRSTPAPQIKTADDIAAEEALAAEEAAAAAEFDESAGDTSSDQADLEHATDESHDVGNQSSDRQKNQALKAGSRLH